MAGIDIKSKSLKDEIRKELLSIIEEDSLADNEAAEAESNAQNPNDKSKLLNKNPHNESTLSSELQLPYNYHVIDTDLQSVRDYLTDSYKYFQKIADRFQNINFQCLNERIKDLSLNKQSDDMLKKIVNDIKKDFDESYIDNRINDLTKNLDSRFGLYSKTFTDIPELNEFFRTCTQLRSGLENLQRQRKDINDLTKRMTLAANISFDRIEEIQNILNEGLPSKPLTQNNITNDDTPKSKSS